MAEMINFEDVFAALGSRKFIKELLDAKSIVTSKVDQTISINECSNGYNRFIKIDLPGVDVVDVKFFIGNADIKLRSKAEGLKLSSLLETIIDVAAPKISPALQVELDTFRRIKNADQGSTV